MITESINIIIESFDNVNPKMTFSKEQNESAHQILRKNFVLLEKQSSKFHETLKQILEQIVFHREQIRLGERDIYIPRIHKFQKKIDKYNREYKRMLREPKTERLI